MKITTIKEFIKYTHVVKKKKKKKKKKKRKWTLAAKSMPESRRDKIEVIIDYINTKN